MEKKNKETKHGWGTLEPLRLKAIERIQEILNNPHSTDRTVGIAIKSLLQLNSQNMALDTETPDQPEIEVRIIEE